MDRTMADADRQENPAGAQGNGSEGDAHESIRAEISRRMVKIYKEQFGRGPTKVRTDFAGPDTLVSTLEHSFTPAEQRLVEMGEHQRMRDTRLYFQHATEGVFRDAVEAVLGRRVRAFLSGLDTAADVSAEVFYLEPRENAAERRQPD